jgi:hypothetical protein
MALLHTPVSITIYIPGLQIYDAGMYDLLENKYVKSTELMKLSRIKSAWYDWTLVN